MNMILPQPINKITFTFENLEHVTFDFEDFGFFQIKNIQLEYSKIGINSNISPRYFSNDIALSIRYDALTKKTSFIDFCSDYSVKERFLKHNDMCYIDLMGGKSPIVSTIAIYCWGGINDRINEYQEIKINKRGDLFLIINEDKNIRNQWLNEDLDSEIIYKILDYNKIHNE